MAQKLSDLVAELNEGWDAMGIDPEHRALVVEALKTYRAALPDSPDPDTAEDALREAILALNEANDEADGAMLETDEREILVPWLIETAADAGLDPKQFDDGDPTGDLREF